MSVERRELTPEEAQRLADYLAGRLADAERQAVEQEILSSPAMAAALYEDVGVEGMLEESGGAGIAGVVRPLPMRPLAQGQRGWLRVALPIAALLALALLTPRLLRMVWSGLEDFRFRSATRSATPGPSAEAAATRPRGLSPSGRIPFPPTHFMWTSDPGARLYRLEIQNEEERLIFFRVTPDTAIAIPRKAVSWEFVRSASWRVVPLAPSGERMPSGTMEFEIVPR